MATGIVRGLPLGVKLAIARQLMSPRVGRVLRLVFRDTVPGCGSRFAVERLSDTAVACIFFNLYERAERHFVSTLLPPDLDVVELGGSLGVVTRTILRRLNPDRRVITVEADPHLAAGLRTTLRDVCDGGRVVIENAAIDYDGGDTRTRFSPARDNLSGSLGDVAGSVEVDRTTLSALTSRHGLGDFSLVCDIEGAEAGMLFCDASALARCRSMVIETHETSYDGRRIVPAELRSRLETLGFRVLAERGPVFAAARP